MRLTEKKEKYIEELKTNGHIYFVDDILPSNCKLTSRSIDKLGQLEDIEEELGIDLVTLFKALKDGVYHKTKGGVWFKSYLDLQFTDSFCLVNYDQQYIFDFKDYGKTWALTKEELE